MRRAVLALALPLVVVALALPATSRAGTPGPCVAGTLPSGAQSLICIPAGGWNGQLVAYAHGYVSAGEPVVFRHLTLAGVYLPDLVQSLGFAFATTSYRENGLAVLPGIEDIRELVVAFRAQFGVPARTYLTGVSEGGIVTALAIERYPELFSGGLAACGPIGDMGAQLSYVADFRVLFDVFFPGVLPPSPVAIPEIAQTAWQRLYVPAIRAALLANPAAREQLFATSHAAFDPANRLETMLETAVGVLWYNVFGTNDAVARLGGNPYDNTGRIYTGSANDVQLNSVVQRFAASPTALANLAPYQTSGNAKVPLVTLHTTGDEIVPAWHEILYLLKTYADGSGKTFPLFVNRYGHCNFTPAEVVTAFAILVGWVESGGGAIQLSSLAQLLAATSRT